MRLLTINDNCEINFTGELLGEDIPPYAILSHTWGAAIDEVSHKDLTDGIAEGKPAYRKLLFCGQQAKRDGLHHFWIDTCCIDKTNNTELSEAINSMFRWYQNAARCYVYLTDVSATPTDTNDVPGRVAWKATFEKSRWFTRGWTLQELIAPVLVYFFSSEGELLGDKQTLGMWISRITGIPERTLHSGDLAQFSIDERLSWQERRRTTREEDKAYSLLGICGVYMPLIYGEGRVNAYKRLREEIDKNMKGTDRENLSVAFSLSEVSDVEHFVAREQELEEIHRVLTNDSSRRQAVVLHGLGGIGKTQLAAAYAKRHRNSYSAIFWFNIKDAESVKQSFSKIARKILRDHPTAARLGSIDLSRDLDQVVDAVKAWLSLPTNTRWLAIYDNYDNPKLPGHSTDSTTVVDIREFLPESYQGSIIVTTRSSRVELGHSLRIRKLQDLKHGLDILSNASKRPDLADDTDAIELAKELDGFPLALATAGAYLHQVTMSLSEYLSLYRESWSRLQETSPNLSSYEDRTLHSTWNISYDRVQKQNISSAMLLQLWAYFDNNDLWFELLQHSEPDDPKWFRELTRDKLSFHAAVRVLADHGFVEANPNLQAQVGSPGYSIHGCVHAWTTHILSQETNQELEKICLISVGSHVPGVGGTQWWLTLRRLLPHASRYISMISSNIDDDIRSASSWKQLGLLFEWHNKHTDAAKMNLRALKGYQNTLGFVHSETLGLVTDLGLQYLNEGKTLEAEEMLQQALRGYEETLGPENTMTLIAVADMGQLFSSQGRLTEAEEMYQRVLQGMEKISGGSEERLTLRLFRRLAHAYESQDKLDQAEKMYHRALQGYDLILGSEHPLTSYLLERLGCVYMSQDKLDEAENAFLRVLEGREKMYGPEHAITLSLVNNIGNVFYHKSRWTEAQDMYQRALEGYEKALGPDNGALYEPASGTAYNMGLLFEDQGNVVEAKRMYSKALAGYRATFGADHEECRMAEARLADLEISQSDTSSDGAELDEL